MRGTSTAMNNPIIELRQSERRVAAALAEHNLPGSVIVLDQLATTAQMAAQASLIGTLIFSTFHTFDIPALITRLQEMGIANSVIAQAFKGVVMTRLLRKICQSCKTEYELTPEEKKKLAVKEDIQKIYRGKGCQTCQNSGYMGRIGVYEITKFDSDIKDSIMEKRPASYMSYAPLKRVVNPS